MKKSKKLIVLIVAVALIAAVGVGSTLAYLTSKTDTVTNTFTVGNYPADLELKEHDVEQTSDGGYKFKDATDPKTEVTSNAYTDILPGVTLDKDPFLRLPGSSPKSYLFMKATGIGALEDLGISVTTTNIGKYWLQVASTEAATGVLDKAVYVYCPAGDGVPAPIEKQTDAYTTEPLFTQLTASTTLAANADLNDLVFIGCAVQVTDGVDYQTAYSSAVFN